MAQLRLTLAGLIGERELGPPVLVVFEGWDASGKGGAIKRLVSPLDPRHVRVAQFAAPSEDERRHHFLWRFWPALPGWGGMAVFDRSWYGRVLVERVEGWRAVSSGCAPTTEITTSSAGPAGRAAILVKLWLHISEEEQLKRFEGAGRRSAQGLEADSRRLGEPRPATRIEAGRRGDARPHRPPPGPWRLIPAESKRYARVEVVQAVNESSKGMRNEAGMRALRARNRRHRPRITGR